VAANLDISAVRANGDVIAGSPVNGQLAATWDARKFGAQASIHGLLGGHPLLARLRAP
jgi:hypothetical protein